MVRMSLIQMSVVQFLLGLLSMTGLIGYPAWQYYAEFPFSSITVVVMLIMASLAVRGFVLAGQLYERHRANQPKSAKPRWNDQQRGRHVLD